MKNHRAEYGETGFLVTHAKLNCHHPGFYPHPATPKSLDKSLVLNKKSKVLKPLSQWGRGLERGFFITVELTLNCHHPGFSPYHDNR
jgi:hypothetical protein